MHPFAFGVTVRAPREGEVATVSGITLEAAMAMKKEERAGGRGSLEFETTTLTARRAVRRDDRRRARRLDVHGVDPRQGGART